MDDALQQGIAAFKAGERENARRLFIEAVKQQPDSEAAWGWMYSACQTDVERIHCLKQVFRLNPGNAKAAERLEKLLSVPDFPFEVGAAPAAQSAPALPARKRMAAVPLEQVGEYVRSILMPSERVLAVAKIHWFIYLSPLVFTFLALVLTVIGIMLVSGGDEEASYVAFGFGLLFWLSALIGLLNAFLTRKYTEFALTDQRVIGKVGILRRSSLELILGKVESIGVNQSLMGRIFRFGTLVISGSGGTRQSFPFIADPMKLKQAVNTILAE